MVERFSLKRLLDYCQKGGYTYMETLDAYKTFLPYEGKTKQEVLNAFPKGLISDHLFDLKEE